MKVALVLGSGGARGYAHIGVINELKRRGHTIAAISGTSMGALVGGLEAAGKLEEFTEWATALSQLDVWRRLDFTLTGPGLVKAEKIIGEIDTMIGGVRIEDLPIPFTAVASDITAQREVWFQHGPLTSAIRASIAIPSVITPVTMSGHILVDGGVCNPVPAEPTLSVPSDVTIAVSLAGRPYRAEPRSVASADDVTDAESSSILRRIPFVNHVRDGEIREEPEDPSEGTRDATEESLADLIRPARRKEAGFMEVVNESIDTMQAMIERYRAAASPAQVHISIPYASASTLDFHKAKSLIELGQDYAVAAFDKAGI